MLKLAIATTFPVDPLRPHGGVEAVSISLVQALAKLEDLDVQVVTTDRGRTRTEVMQWCGAMIHRLPQGKRKELLNAIGPGRKTVQGYIQSLSPDVVHAHDTYGLMVQGMRVPRVFTIHGFIHGDIRVSHERLRWLRWRLWKRFEVACWAEQPCIISINPYVRERLNGIASGQVFDIDNPISPEFFSIPRREQPEIIFSAGLICARKNQLGLLEACAQLCDQGIDCQLRLAGHAAEPSYHKSLRQRIRELDLTDRVHMLGPLSADDMRQELGQAAVFALLSLEENSPMSIEEAMAAGVPVVTSNRCGMPYMVEDGVTGYLVNPEDITSTTTALKNLLTNDVVRADMGQASRDVAHKRFHPRAVALKTREVYRQAMRLQARQEVGCT